MFVCEHDIHLPNTMTQENSTFSMKIINNKKHIFICIHLNSITYDITVIFNLVKILEIVLYGVMTVKISVCCTKFKEER